MSKAFDSVPHQAIAACLEARGVPGPLRREILAMYEDSSIRFKNCGGFEVGLKRGVKQGDPLSALLFNIVLDPLLVKLENQGGGLKVGDLNISVLAFAYDLVLLACDPVAAQLQLDMVESHLSDIGMELAVAKCGAFRVKRFAKRWVTPGVEMRVGADLMKEFSAEECFRYLGAYFTVGAGLDNS